MGRPHILHYTGGIEPIDYIEDHGWMVGFCLGNIIKYATRCLRKGEAIDDLEKIRRYAEMLQDHIEGRGEDELG